MLFMRRFDKSCWTWDKNPEFNRMYLQGVMVTYSEVFRRAGHLALNDLFDNIGLEKTKETFTYGWHKDGNIPMNFSIVQVADTADFLLTFECEEILDYFESEGA